MDLGDMLGVVDLGDETVAKLTVACEAKASALREARETLVEKFGSKARVGTAEVLAWLDNDIADYEAGSQAAYWRGEIARPEPVVPPKATRKRKNANAAVVDEGVALTA